MTRVDFYILSDTDENSRQHFAARLCEKAIRNGVKPLLISPVEQIAALDEVLWSFRPESFLAHHKPEQQHASDLVFLSSGKDNPEQHDMLINLSEKVPPMFSRFQRLAEIVIQDPAVLAATRSNYSFYKERGYPVQTHKIQGR